jgi:hypothetical protein
MLLKVWPIAAKRIRRSITKGLLRRPNGLRPRQLTILTTNEKNIKKLIKLLTICNIVPQYSKGIKVSLNYQNVSKKPLIFSYSNNAPILLTNKINVK